MRANSKSVALLLISLMLVKSTDYNQALDDTHYHVLIEKNPASYFLLPVAFTYFSHLSSQALTALSDLKVSGAQLERAKRLLFEREYDSASRYSLSVYRFWPLEHQKKWLNILIDMHRFELLSKLASASELPPDYQYILNLANQEQISRVPLPLHGRLSLEAETQFEPSCANKVQVIVDSLDGLLSVENLITRFDKKPEPFDGAFCFSTPLYSNQKMQCDETENGFAECKLDSTLVAELEVAQANYLMIVTESGLANVIGKVMTLNYQSDYNVLVHELMHFSGFEDEYAFLPKKAQRRCKQKGLIAPNLYVGEEGDAPYGWVQNASCQYGKYSSFRPINGWTTLEYHGVPLNHLYRDKWAKLIRQNSALSL